MKKTTNKMALKGLRKPQASALPASVKLRLRVLRWSSRRPTPN